MPDPSHTALDVIRNEAIRLDGDARDYEALLERAIGVLYRADTEYESHYFMASIAAQFDAVFHLDETTAVESLDMVAARLEIQPV
jgi:erythromycin esterase-like protein